MDPARPSCLPPNPPKTIRTLNSKVAGCSADTGTGPTRASQMESVEYAQLEFPSVNAKPVKRTYENAMFSCVDVYASIDHNTKAPPLPPSSLPPYAPPSSSSLPPTNRPVDTIDEIDDETTTIL